MPPWENDGECGQPNAINLYKPTILGGFCSHPLMVNNGEPLSFNGVNPTIKHPQYHLFFWGRIHDPQVGGLSLGLAGVLNIKGQELMAAIPSIYNSMVSLVGNGSRWV